MSSEDASAPAEPDASDEPGRPDSIVRRWWRPDGDPWATALIVHGIAEHSGRYERTGAHLASHGILVAAIDLPGFGDRESPGHIDSWNEFRDATERGLDEVSALGHPTFLLGHSMGGLVALDFVLHVWPQLAGLILSAPALDAVVPGWKRNAARVLSETTPRMPIPNEVSAEMLSRDPAVGEAYFADPLVMTSNSARLGAELLRTMGETREGLSELDRPTLCIHGEDDELVPPEFSEPLGELDCVDRRTYAGVRHEAFNEPEGPEIVDEIVEWMREQVPIRPHR
ncbi:MAG: lysophospholipase [Solirubrobacterales bacterium]